MNEKLTIKQCTWTCPTCGEQCGGTEGHEQRNLVHQCKIHYDSRSYNANFCPATITHKHKFVLVKETDTIKMLHCNACQFDLEVT